MGIVARVASWSTKHCALYRENGEIYISSCGDSAVLRGHTARARLTIVGHSLELEVALPSLEPKTKIQSGSHHVRNIKKCTT